MAKTNKTKEQGNTVPDMVGFRPTAENKVFLQKCKDAGLGMSEVISEALSEHGPAVAKRLAKESIKKAEAFLKG